MQNICFKVKKKKWESLVELRSWEHPISTLAKRTGFTKSYCSQVINGELPISHDFMLAIINVAGASCKETGEWGGLFEIVRSGERLSEHYQKDNYAKYQGKKAYTELSVIGKIRKEDKALSLERLKMPVPIPANEFYQDNEIVPKKCYNANRFKN